MTTLTPSKPELIDLHPPAADMLRLMGASEEVISEGKGFTAMLLGGNASILFLFLLNAGFRGAGDAPVAQDEGIDVVAQLLLPTADGKGRVASHEILVRTSALPNIIREGNTAMLASIIQNGKAVGMQTMDDSLMQLYKDKRILAEDAAEYVEKSAGLRGGGGFAVRLRS